MSQEPEKTNGAQELLNFCRDFAEDYGRFPKIHELPVKKVTVVYHFGSYETLMRVARIGEPILPKRRDRKKRYCRHCGKLLPRERWFFCAPLNHAGDINPDNVKPGCQEKFEEKHSRIFTETELRKKPPKGKRRMWHKCKACPEKCKIYLPSGAKEPKAKVICRADPEYGEINEKFSKGI